MIEWIVVYLLAGLGTVFCIGLHDDDLPDDDRFFGGSADDELYGALMCWLGWPILWAIIGFCLLGRLPHTIYKAGCKLTTPKKKKR